MNRFGILKSLVPLAIYFVADYFFGPVWGMVAGLLLCVPDIVQSLRKNGLIEGGSWTEMGLIIFFGVTSLVSEIEAIKPFATLMVSFMVSGLLALAVWSPFNIFTTTGGEIMKGVLADPFRVKLLNHSVKRMFIWSISFTAVLTFFVLIPNFSTGSITDSQLVWFVVILFFASEMLIARMRGRKYRNQEWLPVVDEEGRVTGRAPRSMFHDGNKWLHPVVHLHVLTSGGVLLQKRPMHKSIQPGKWDTAVGGHVAVGETLEKALQRETMEEIGLQAFEARLLKQYIWDSRVEKELVFCFVTTSDGPFKAGFPEIDEIKSWSMDEIKNSIGKGVFTPNLEKEFGWILPFLAGINPE